MSNDHGPEAIRDVMIDGMDAVASERKLADGVVRSGPGWSVTEIESKIEGPVALASGQGAKPKVFGVGIVGLIHMIDFDIFIIHLLDGLQ